MRARLVVVGLAAVGLLGQAAWAAEIPGPSAHPDVLVTDDVTLTRTHEASNLAIDRDDPDTVYLSEVEMQSGDCRLYVSTDRGGTWTPEGNTVDSPLEAEPDDDVLAPETEPYTDCGFGSAQPQNIRTDLEQAPDGTLHYAFHANDPAAGGTRSVLLGRSTDRGRSWETTVVHGGPKATSPAEVEVNFVQHVTVDPDSPARVYMTWRRSFPRVGEEDPRPTRPWMAISEDGGESFGEPFMMLDENTGFDAPRLIVVGERLFAFYRVSAPSEPEGAPTRLFSAVSTDQGESWEETEIASAADASEPIPAYDRDRNVFFVVWHDNRNGDLDVFFSQSADGTTWSPPARLNDDEPENGRGQYYPQLALSPGGQLHVAWYDYRDDPYPPPAPDELGEPLTLGSNLGQLQSVYYARSDDAGQTWLPNVRVNDVLIDRTIGTWNAQFFVVVPVSIAAWDDRALVSWSDTRNGTAATGTQDIYASAVTLEEQEQQVAAGSSLPLIFGSVAGALIGAGLALWAAVWVMRRTRRRAEAPA